MSVHVRASPPTFASYTATTLLTLQGQMHPSERGTGGSCRKDSSLGPLPFDHHGSGVRPSPTFRVDPALRTATASGDYRVGGSGSGHFATAGPSSQRSCRFALPAGEPPSANRHGSIIGQTKAASGPIPKVDPLQFGSSSSRLSSWARQQQDIDSAGGPLLSQQGPARAGSNSGRLLYVRELTSASGVAPGPSLTRETSAASRQQGWPTQEEEQGFRSSSGSGAPPYGDGHPIHGHAAFTAHRRPSPAPAATMVLGASGGLRRASLDLKDEEEEAASAAMGCVSLATGPPRAPTATTSVLVGGGVGVSLHRRVSPGRLSLSEEEKAAAIAAVGTVGFAPPSPKLLRGGLRRPAPKLTEEEKAATKASVDLDPSVHSSRTRRTRFVDEVDKVSAESPVVE